MRGSRSKRREAQLPGRSSDRKGRIGMSAIAVKTLFAYVIVVTAGTVSPSMPSCSSSFAALISRLAKLRDSNGGRCHS